MPRYLLDTNIFIYLATERDQISEDVYDAISEPDALLYMSVESVREMVTGYYNKSFDIRQWKTEKAMIEAIEKQYYIKVLPLTDQIIKTFAEIKSDVAKGHKGSIRSCYHFPCYYRADDTCIKRYPFPALCETWFRVTL